MTRKPTPADPGSIPWKELSALLDEALALEGAQREALVRRVSDRSPALGGKLADMLRHAESPSFLEAGAVEFAGPAWDDEETSDAFTPGWRIGHYRIVRRLAVGGMSVVYLVERDDDQFERTAVLKVLEHVGLDPDEAQRRFQAERQILATLDHPNIAGVYDGGVTPDGRPYLVLEYVPGEPITDHCQRLGLSVEDRLRIFETVCRAVQHAHRGFVVHRDLKPANILVREDGVVKLLDFGIAKLLDREDADGAPMTRTGMRLLTPEYAAPEQVRGGAITSATDVYALGVLLHELLTGERPYSLAGLPPSEIERIVCEEDPPRPSTRIARGGGVSSSAPPDLGRRRLRGDLDTIVLRALRKEPRERYASPRDLADDVSRHLRSLPIEARGTSILYRSRRYLRRHQLAVAAAAAVLAFGVFHMVQITGERNHARREAEKAAQVSAFLTGLFELSDPDVSRGESITARDLLDQATRRIRGELSGQPEVRADMLMVLGDVHRRLSLHGRAVPLVEEAWRIRRDRFGETGAETAEALELLGDLQLELGQYAVADSLFEASLAVRRKRFGEHHPQTASAWQALGVSALNQNSYARADSCLQKALAIRRTAGASSREDLSRTLKDLGMVRTARGDLAGAEPLLREGLQIRQQLLGDSHSDVYIAMTNLGDNLALQGRFEEAIPLLHEGTEGLQRLLGDVHAEVAEGLNVFGITLSQAGRYDEAEAALRHAADIRSKLYGENHPDYARGLNDLAVMLLYREDHAAAEPLLRRSLELNRQFSGEDALVVAINYANLARALSNLGRYEEALEFSRLAEASHLANFGPDHIRVARARLGRAEVLHRQGKLDEAETLYRSLIEPFRRAYPEGSPRLGGLLVDLGALLTGTGRAGEALPLLEEGEAMYARGRGDASMETARARLALAACLSALGRFSEAEPRLASGLAVEERYLPAEHPLLRAAWSTAAEVHEGLGQPDRARLYRSRLASR